MKIGISLSGGGVRATVFHLGILCRLAESGQWENLCHISTVSGGSICVGLIFAVNGGNWPTASEYLQHVLPAAKARLTTKSLMGVYLGLWALRPWLLVRGRAHLLGLALTRTFGLTLSLKDLPPIPRWTINCTTYETGKNWRFSSKRMGDYVTGYVLNPDFPVALAVGASAGFPGGIGPLRIRANDFNWVRFKPGSRSETEPCQPLHHRYQLWDGGVYENLGSEALVKPNGGLREDLDFYIACDAGKRIGLEFRRFKLGFPFYLPPLRLLDCAMDQVRALRARTVIAQAGKSGIISGFYLQIGETPEVMDPAFPAPEKIDQDAARRSAAFPTTLRRLADSEFEMICNHGFEVAAAVLPHLNRRADGGSTEATTATLV